MNNPPVVPYPSLTGRGVRKINTDQNPQVGAADARPIVIAYSWELDNGADSTMVDFDNRTNTMNIKSSFSYKFRFSQTTIKRTNIDITSLKGTGSFSTPPTQAGAGPNIGEIKVFNLPNVFKNADYISGVQEWTLDDCRIQAYVEDDYYVMTNSLSAETHWFRQPLLLSKETVQLNTVLTEENFS